MLTVGNFVDCANPVNRAAPLNRGLASWIIYVPGLANLGAPTTGALDGGICHDLMRLPGGLAKMNQAQNYNEGVHGAYQGNVRIVANYGTSITDSARPGSLGASFKFFGSTPDAILLGGYNMPSASSLMFSKTQPFSGFLWINQNTSDFYLISNWINGSDPGWIFDVKTTFRNLRFRLCDADDSNGRKVEDTAGMMPVGKWLHVGFTYDGSDTAAGINLYLNGQSLALTTVADSDPGTLTAFSPQIGNGAVVFRSFSGRLDDVRIYNRCLPPAEVMQLYIASMTGYRRELNRISLAAVSALAAPGGFSGLLLVGVGG